MAAEMLSPRVTPNENGGYKLVPCENAASPSLETRHPHPCGWTPSQSTNLFPPQIPRMLVHFNLSFLKKRIDAWEGKRAGIKNFNCPSHGWRDQASRDAFTAG